MSWLRCSRAGTALTEKSRFSEDIRTRVVCEQLSKLLFKAYFFSKLCPRLKALNVDLNHKKHRYIKYLNSRLLIQITDGHEAQ